MITSYFRHANMSNDLEKKAVSNFSNFGKQNDLL